MCMQCLRGPEESLGFPETWYTGDCESPSVDTGNWTQFLWKRSKQVSWSSSDMLRVCLLLNLQCSLWLKLAALQPPGIYLSLFPSATVISIHVHTLCYVGPGDTNPGPWAWRASTLSTESLPLRPFDKLQLCFVLAYFEILFCTRAKDTDLSDPRVSIPKRLREFSRLLGWRLGTPSPP